MSRFNAKPKPVGPPIPKADTTNLAGGKAFSKDDRVALVSLLTTTMLNGGGGGETDDATIKRLGQLIGTVDPEFSAKAAVYVRTQHGLRSITHLLAALLVPHAHGKTWAKHFYNKVVHRVDDMTEILAAMWAISPRVKGKIPHAMQRGFRDAIPRFNEYQLGKYSGGSKQVKLVDLVNLVRPRSNPAVQKLMTKKLESPDTWEVAISAAGSDPEKKAAEWTRLLEEGKIGTFALLRNVNNITKSCGDGSLMRLLCSRLTNEDEIKKSLIMPFQYAKAIKAVTETGVAGRPVISALQDAIDISIGNVGELPGSSIVVLDTSGSMDGTHGPNGRGQENPESPISLGANFAATLVKALNCPFMMFHERASFKTLNRRKKFWGVVQDIFALRESGGTDFKTIFKLLMESHQKYNRVFILSDEQGWVGRDSPQRIATEWARTCDVKPTIYSWDLAHSGTTQLQQSADIDVVCLSGWTDKVFDIIKVAEEDPEDIFREIEAIQLHA